MTSLYAFYILVGLAGSAFANEDTSQCANFVKDNTETDVDCGGTVCWARCAVGQMCNDDDDCESGKCVANVCMFPGYNRILNIANSAGKSGPSGPAAVVEDKVILESSLQFTGLSASDFGEEEKEDLTESIANSLGVDKDRVVIQQIIDLGADKDRRLNARTNRRLASHSAGVIVLYSVVLAEAGASLDEGLLTRVQEKMDSFDEDSDAVETILDNIAQSTGKDRSALTVTSGGVIQSEGAPAQCKKNEKVQDNKCVQCPFGKSNAAGDFASGPDTECKYALAAGFRKVNIAFVGMVFVGIAFTGFVLYEVYKKMNLNLKFKKKTEEINTEDMTKI